MRKFIDQLQQVQTRRFRETMSGDNIGLRGLRKKNSALDILLAADRLRRSDGNSPSEARSPGLSTDFNWRHRGQRSQVEGLLVYAPRPRSWPADHQDAAAKAHSCATSPAAGRARRKHGQEVAEHRAALEAASGELYTCGGGFESKGKPSRNDPPPSRSRPRQPYAGDSAHSR